MIFLVEKFAFGWISLHAQLSNHYYILLIALYSGMNISPGTSLAIMKLNSFISNTYLNPEEFQANVWYFIKTSTDLLFSNLQNMFTVFLT